jgi:phage/conjugal plasmid C-4 type zinc finger TraR family protein
VTDIYDRATIAEENARSDALDKQRRRAGLDGKTSDDSATVCSECEEPIPDARRQAVPGVQTCIDCQSALEAMA